MTETETLDESPSPPESDAVLNSSSSSPAPSAAPAQAAVTTEKEPSGGKLLPNQSAHALWLEAEDHLGRRYYFHKFSMRTQWIAPAAVTPQRWYSARDAAGRTFYFRHRPPTSASASVSAASGASLPEVEAVWSLPQDAIVIDEAETKTKTLADRADTQESASASASASASSSSSSNCESSTSDLVADSPPPPADAESSSTQQSGEGEIEVAEEQDLPLPAYWEMVGETGWQMVRSLTDEVYFYHIESKQSVWDIPDEVAAYQQQLNAQLASSQQPTTPPLLATDRISASASASASTSSSSSITVTSTSTATPSDSGSSAPLKDPYATKAQRVQAFLDMLREKNISPTSTWEKTLPKLAFDSRFRLLDSHAERKTIFDQYVRDRAWEIREEKQKQQDQFRALVDQCLSMQPYMSFALFSEAVHDHEHFGPVNEIEREKIFREQSSLARKKADEAKRVREKATRKGFLELLRKLDPPISSRTHWSDIKYDLRKDPRYEAVGSSELCEDLFREYRRTIEDAERSKRRLAERQSEALRKRDRERGRTQQEFERKRVRVQRDHALSELSALFVERIRDPESQSSWREAIRLLEHEPRFSSDTLTVREKEDAFRRHIEHLWKRRRDDFRSHLKEFDATHQLPLNARWEEVSEQLSADPRFARVDARDRLRVFESYMRSAREEAIEQLRELLSKTTSAKELIAADRRWLRMASLPEERERIFK
eukprot:CAMPEP_0174233108 /NCGR_PEP_ID=MMETSP0417-20130205/3232_1 /TAXON_ID=242541 /ORGANISM="Mayorella sp, Strain BSH-02190019" /LENGTH=716 /DNA_ID=CAMNT_0015311273 /DNA_START=12 /DNA_END=2159 /DNA_ORIENTATION=-